MKKNIECSPKKEKKHCENSPQNGFTDEKKKCENSPQKRFDIKEKIFKNEKSLRNFRPYLESLIDHAKKNKRSEIFLRNKKIEKNENKQSICQKGNKSQHSTPPHTRKEFLVI